MSVEQRLTVLVPEGTGDVTVSDSSGELIARPSSPLPTMLMDFFVPDQDLADYTTPTGEVMVDNSQADVYKIRTRSLVKEGDGESTFLVPRFEATENVNFISARVKSVLHHILYAFGDENNDGARIVVRPSQEIRVWWDGDLLIDTKTSGAPSFYWITLMYRADTQTLIATEHTHNVEVFSINADTNARRRFGVGTLTSNNNNDQFECRQVVGGFITDFTGKLPAGATEIIPEASRNMRMLGAATTPVVDSYVDGGTTYQATIYADASSNVKVSVRENDGSGWGSFTTYTIGTLIEYDTHFSPSLAFDAAGYLHFAFNNWSLGGDDRIVRSDAPVSTWTGGTTVPVNNGRTNDMTYVSFGRNPSGILHAIYRSNGAVEGTTCVQWNAATQEWDAFVGADPNGVIVERSSGNGRTYAQRDVHFDNDGNLHLFWSHPSTNSIPGIWYTKYQVNDGTWRTADGTDLGAPPLQSPIADALVFSESVQFHIKGMIEPDGTPFVQVDTGFNDVGGPRLSVSRWNGTEWEVLTVRDLMNEVPPWEREDMRFERTPTELYTFIQEQGNDSPIRVYTGPLTDLTEVASFPRVRLWGVDRNLLQSTGEMYILGQDVQFYHNPDGSEGTTYINKVI